MAGIPAAEAAEDCNSCCRCMIHRAILGGERLIVSMLQSKRTVNYVPVRIY